MLVSCGVDIVSVKRVERLLDKYGERFIRKVFPEGIDYCFKKRKGELAGCIAARFALKEAVIKAFASIGKRISFKDIVICGGGSHLTLKVKNFEDLKLLTSISHEKEYAVAIVNVLQKN
ncbi:holo-ACP synthase [Phorcysia thermohydrogeniphila]|uniref:Holo-[acyl-carrier-protein] synthase n=1 Tax=Phorcysia thermohydrogeniphila TaxID=936138 RepID=A0A4V2PD70_9BACT|nr:holo-ACP synthase [Phorcysia thermohydrogeniphila]TCK04026.1 holo-[acyl-carrier protein] synthase [Phorcysia thermohydrogeniphila]